MSGMTAIPDLQSKLESLLNQLDNHEQELDKIEVKLEEAVQKIIKSSVVRVN